MSDLSYGILLAISISALYVGVFLLGIFAGRRSAQADADAARQRCDCGEPAHVVTCSRCFGCLQTLREKSGIQYRADLVAVDTATACSDECSCPRCDVGSVV